MLIQNTGRVRHHCLSRGHSRHCLYSSDSRRPRPLRVTVSPTNNWTGLGHEQKAVKSQFKNIIYFAHCSIYTNAPQKKSNKSWLVLLWLHFICCIIHTVAVFSLAIVSSSSPPSWEEHSTPLSSPPVAMTMEGVCLSAGRQSERCYRTHRGSFILKEVVTDGFWSDPVKSGLWRTSCLLTVWSKYNCSRCPCERVRKLTDTWAAACSNYYI